MKVKILILLFAAAIIVACEPDKTCRQELDVVAGISLQGLSVDTAGVPTAFTSWDSITVQGVDNDSVLYNNTYTVSQLLLPLRNDTNITTYSLVWHDTEDKVYIKHDNTQRFISMACGCVIYHTIDDVWCDGTWIDSVKIVNSAVETVKQDNIKIFVTIYN